MRNNRVLLIAGLITWTSFTSLSGNQQLSEARPSTTAQEPILAFKNIWVVDDGEDIAVEIYKKSAGIYDLRFTREGTVIRSIAVPPADLGAYPQQLFTLADGNLATVWSSGGPYLIINVFSYKGGKVVPVLRAFSKVYPEFAVLGTGVVGGNETEQHLPAQAIIITKAEWVAVDKNAGSKLMPVKADLYWWDKSAGKYRSRLGLPWEKRFSATLPFVDQPSRPSARK